MTTTTEAPASVRLKEAKGEFEEAETDAADAFRAVELARQRLALGEATRGDLQKAQNRHARACERRENARSAVAAWTRRSDEERLAADQHRLADLRARAAEANERHAALVDEAAELLAGFRSQIDDLTRRMTAHNSAVDGLRASCERLATGPRPEVRRLPELQHNGAYRRLIASVDFVAGYFATR